MPERVRWIRLDTGSWDVLKHCQNSPATGPEQVRHLFQKRAAITQLSNIPNILGHRSRLSSQVERVETSYGFQVFTKRWGVYLRWHLVDDEVDGLIALLQLGKQISRIRLGSTAHLISSGLRVAASTATVMYYNMYIYIYIYTCIFMCVYIYIYIYKHYYHCGVGVYRI